MNQDATHPDFVRRLVLSPASTGRRAGTWVASCLLIAVVGSAGAQGREAVARRASLDLGDLAVPTRWREGDRVVRAGGGGRQAIVVAADETQGQPSWRIHFASTNVVRLTEALQRWGGFAGSAITALQGERVNESAVKASILGAARKFEGKGNLLMVYYTGHGAVDASDSPYFFTYFTAPVPDARTYDNVIDRSELQEWLAQAKLEARDRGAEFDVLLVLDACRRRDLAPPRAARITAVSDWEWYGTKPGNFAEAPVGDSPSLFTGAVIETMARLARAGEANLEQLAEQVTRVMLQRTGTAQEPELLRPGGTAERIVLVQPNRVSIAIQPVDAVTGALLVVGETTVGTQTIRGGGLMQVSVGRHSLRAQAAGYLRRLEEIDIDGSRSGQILEVPLHPELVVVRGRVAPARVTLVRWRGQAGITDYHLREATTGSDGTFLLRLPPQALNSELEVIEAGRVVRAVALPTQVTTFERPSGAAYEGVPAIDIGTITLPSVTTELVLDAVAVARVALNVPLPAEVSDQTLRVALRFPNDAVAEGQLRDAIKQAKGGLWRLARTNLEEVYRNSQADDSTRVRLVRLLAYVAVQEMATGTTAAETEQLAAHLAPFPIAHQALKALLVQRAAEDAQTAVEASALRDPEPAAAQLAVLLERIRQQPASVSWTPVVTYGENHYRTLVARFLRRLLDGQRWDDVIRLAGTARRAQVEGVDRVLADAYPVAIRGALEAGIRAGLTTGDWRWAQALGDSVRGPWATWATAEIAELTTTVGREAITADARRVFTAAQRAFAAGDLDGALRLYTDALPGANAYYRGTIDKQREYLRQRLFAQYRNEGETAELEGDNRRALEAYLRASDFDARVDGRIGALLAAGVRGDSTRVRGWARRSAALANTPSFLEVTTDPPGAQVRVGTTALGAAPVTRYQLTATNALEISATTSMGTTRTTVTVPPASVVKIHFEMPRDTLPWPTPLSREGFITQLGLREKWPADKGRPSQPQALGSRSSWFEKLVFLGTAATVGIQVNKMLWAKPLTDSANYDWYVGAAAVVGGWITSTIVSKMHQAIYESRVEENKRAILDYPATLASWRRQDYIDQEQWVSEHPELRNAVRVDERRVDRERERIRRENELILARNRTAAVPSVTIGRAP